MNLYLYMSRVMGQAHLTPSMVTNKDIIKLAPAVYCSLAPPRGSRFTPGLVTYEIMVLLYFITGFTYFLQGESNNILTPSNTSFRKHLPCVTGQ